VVVVTADVLGAPAPGRAVVGAVAGSVVAGSVVAGSVVAGSVVAGSVVAGSVVAGSVVAVEVEDPGSRVTLRPVGPTEVVGPPRAFDVKGAVALCGGWVSVASGTLSRAAARSTPLRLGEPHPPETTATTTSAVTRPAPRLANERSSVRTRRTL
jgi:hypothetical protein